MRMAEEFRRPEISNQPQEFDPPRVTPLFFMRQLLAGV